MSYGVFCTFDLKNNATANDYKIAYQDLEKIGLKRVVVGTTGSRVIPTTSVIGNFSGGSVNTVRDYVRQQVANAFKARGFKSEIFVFVGDNTTWGATTT
jgi:hypothetical protein